MIIGTAKTENTPQTEIRIECLGKRKGVKIEEAILSYKNQKWQGINNPKRRMSTFTGLKQSWYRRLPWSWESCELQLCPQPQQELVRGNTDIACSHWQGSDALCSCEGIYNPVIHTAELRFRSLQWVPGPGVFLFTNSDVKRNGK